MKIIPAFKRATGRPYPFEEEPCAMCGDPNRAPGNWHSEDYSEPFSFEAPESFPVCGVCHSRLHKRFNAEPGEWKLYCLFLASGGYGSEFTKCMTLRERRALAARISSEERIELASMRELVDRPNWWEDLTLDPESLEAPWARPRPLRPRPDADAFSTAFKQFEFSETERSILRFHSASSRRTASMRQIAKAVLGVNKPQSVNLAYGRLAKKVCGELQWHPDRRADGSKIWMSLFAEGWQPAVREYEWTMVSTAATAAKKLGILP
ncbi:hypothetical protein A8B75_19290 [Sphingomonadales bacterium EhC05]|nr:hypothetical protein A8B75_19290 [Sphingomonadales bacterium EhC05]